MLKHKKLVSVIATLAICLSFLAPALLAPAPAVAAAGLSVTGGVKSITSGDPAQAVGTLKIVADAGDIASGDTIFITLPDDYTFGADFNADVVDASAGGNEVVVPATFGDDANGLLESELVIESGGAEDGNELQITATADQDLDNDCVIYVYFRDVDVDSTSDDCVAVVDGPATTGFPTGSVTLAKLSSGGEVTLTVKDTETGNNDFTFDLRIKEDVKEALEAGSESIKLQLPDGFEWIGNTAKEATTLWGDAIDITVTQDEDELEIAVDAVTAQASGWEISDLRFQVVDEEDVKAGDIMVKVYGESSLTPSELKVGKYGDYGVTVTADSTPDVFAGQLEQEIGDITIEENIGETLIDNRYITLTLPSYAKWTQIDEPDEDGGVTLDFVGCAGSEGSVLKYTIDNTLNSTTAAELTFEDMEIALDVTAPGDLVVKIGGNAGISGEVVVAKVVMPVTISAAAPTEIKIGASYQPISDVIITEAVAGAIDEDKPIWLKVPAGCEFAKNPTVTVEAGDIDLDLTQVKRFKDKEDLYQFISIPVDNDSNVASTIKVSGLLITTERTVPEGNLYVALLGSAVLASNTYGAYTNIANAVSPLGAEGYTIGSSGMFPQTSAIGAAAAAKIVTPAPTQTGNSASFYIGSTVMVVNGSNVIMDAAPYIKDGRTFVPVRYLGDALGATTAWDAATKTVTVTKGEKTIVLVIGSKTAMVNGVAVAMDVAPEIVGGRTMLPARYVAEGLGYSVGYNAALQQVIIQ